MYLSPPSLLPLTSCTCSAAWCVSSCCVGLCWCCAASACAARTALAARAITCLPRVWLRIACALLAVQLADEVASQGLGHSVELRLGVCVDPRGGLPFTEASEVRSGLCVAYAVGHQAFVYTRRLWEQLTRLDRMRSHGRAETYICICCRGRSRGARLISRRSWPKWRREPDGPTQGETRLASWRQEGCTVPSGCRLARILCRNIPTYISDTISTPRHEFPIINRLLPSTAGASPACGVYSLPGPPHECRLGLP